MGKFKRITINFNHLKKQIIMKKILLYGAIALSLNSFAQTPTYVPSNGLVGWWPFNSNANDESGNGNNGTVNGATLSSDRYANVNSAYNFDGLDNYILFTLNSISNSFPVSSETTTSVWVQTTDPDGPIISMSGVGGYEYLLHIGTLADIVQSAGNYGMLVRDNCCGAGNNIFGGNVVNNDWHMITVIRSSDGTLNLYKDGILDVTSSASQSGALNFSTTTMAFGADLAWVIGSQSGGCGSCNSVDQQHLNGKIDDIGIWNRALNQQEITNLYNSVNCANNTSITPQINSLSTGSAASFTATTSDPSPSFIWQSDLGQGFQSLNDFGNYSSVNTNMLSLANVQLSEHNQEIRAISTSGNCIDTSNVAVINILDTCITNVTVTDTTYIAINDTTFISVTDTLIINAILTGLNPPNNQNTLKVFPNPASTHITIDYGNFSSMGGYTLKITNNLGQVVFTTPISQQSSYIDLSTWSGTGIYFVEIIDTQNNTIENRKILIQ